MCDNTKIHDQVQESIATATREVDAALQSVRQLKSTILAQMYAEAEAAGLYDNEPTLDQVAEAIKTIRKHNADPDRGIYLEQGEYMDLMQYKDQVERVRHLADNLQNKEAFHQLTAWACSHEIFKALYGEIGSVKPVKLEALDGEQS